MPVSASTSYHGAVAIHAGYYPGGRVMGDAAEGADTGAGGGTPGWPVTASGNAAEGGDTAAGGAAGPFVPSWRAGATPLAWLQIPGSNWAAADPGLSALYNPNYPAASPWDGDGGHGSMVNSWGSACADTARGKVWYPLQGGHHDNASNAPFVHLTNQNSPAFSMVRAPSGAVGNTITLNDGNEATGLYSDGRLRATHAYNDNIYVPGLGPVVARGAAVYYSGQANFNRCYAISETTGEATLLVDYSAVAHVGSIPCAAEYDLSRNTIWLMSVGTASLIKINLSTLSASEASGVTNNNNNAGTYLIMRMLPEHDLLAVIQTGGAGYPAQFYLLDNLSGSPTRITPTLTGALSAGASLTGTIGAVWRGGKLYLWNNGSNTTEVSRLYPSGDPRTAPWTQDVQPLDPSNTVSPSTANPQGTFGRLANIYDGLYLLNAVNQPAYYLPLS